MQKAKSKDNSITLTMPPLSKKVSKASWYFLGNVSDHLWHQLANIDNSGDTEDEELKSGPAGSNIHEQQAPFFYSVFFVPLIIT